ncbi:unnamed protein product [Rotaria magnacalcarata]|uniref:Uncharacterized protein n=1 Tax=Rotaria magnacalcarata TaxID=392030 RepID=A0A816Y364_9BILA|nr:unnamed protein product [Rotaria magnacalcarata]CAF2153910.1 unnamed protein product [Rotaria magnacalcarata]CAF4045531.1 unnamed protein product [Rotaria magnacalcarata]CAF4080896.1 unnamed protein product [Rotaria magnacalcarata]
MESNTDTSGYTQLATAPIMNMDSLILIACDNINYTNANIYLINQSGQIIDNYSSKESNQFEILTKIRVPQKPFRIEIILTLTNGKNVQRIEKQLISSIELTNQPWSNNSNEL